MMNKMIKDEAMEKQNASVKVYRRFLGGFFKQLFMLSVTLGIIAVMARPCPAVQSVLYGLEAEGGWVSIKNISKDQDGYIYVIGTFTGNKLEFNQNLYLTYTPDGTDWRAFLAKLSPAGEWVEAKTLEKDYIPEFIVVKDNYIYTGFGSLPESSKKKFKKMRTGDLATEKTAEITTSGTVVTYDIAVDGLGNLYACGYFTKDVAFGAIDFYPIESNPSGNIIRYSYIARLDNSFNWEWASYAASHYYVAIDGGTEARYSHSNFAGLAGDATNNVYVIANVDEPTWVTTYYNMDYENRDGLKKDYKVCSKEGLNYLTLKLSANGDVMAHDVVSGPPNIYEPVDILMANEKVYTMESFSDGFTYVLYTLNSDMGDKTLCAYVKFPEIYKAPIFNLGENGNIYITGEFPSQVKFADRSGELAQIDDNTLYSINGNFFVAKTNENLEWLWARKLACSDPDNQGCTEPDDLLEQAGLATVGDLTYVAGNFKGGTLVVGDTPPYGEIISGGKQLGFIAPIFKDGTIARNLDFTLNSIRDGNNFKEVTMYVDGLEVAPDLGQKKLYPYGTHIRIEAEELVQHDINGDKTDDPDQIVTKIACKGYDAQGIPGGTTTICEFDLTQDTTIDFLWETRHVLIIVQNFDDAVGLTSNDSGDPVPDAGTNWDYVKGEDPVSPEINGIISDPITPGTRFIVTGYTLQQGVNFDTDVAITEFDAIQTRQKIPEFYMNTPARVTYFWRRENRLQVSTTLSEAADLPLTEVCTSSCPTVVGDNDPLIPELTKSGSNEFWFPHNSYLRVRSQDVGYIAQGYINGTGNVPLQGDNIPLTFKHNQGSTITLKYGQEIFYKTVRLGDPVTLDGIDVTPDSAKPTITLVDSPPASTQDDMMAWDDITDKIYPLRPGKTLLEWHCTGGTDCTDETVITQIESVVPDKPHYSHVADTPPVILDSDPDDPLAFKELKYTTCDAVVNQEGEFTSSLSGYSVLMFSESMNPDRPANGDLTQEEIRVKVVSTKFWNEGILSGTADIGTPITSQYHDALLLEKGLNGYVFWKKARYNPEIYNREKPTGPIIPVNRQFTKENDDDLVVVWYSLVDGIAWPSTPVRYDCQWPNTPNRIVIASRLGTEGKDSNGNDQLKFESPRYKEVTVYNQPDPEQAGYNPNEEHALVADAYMNEGAQRDAAFALRNDLNITSQDDQYTSEPLVLVQYYDDQEKTYKMVAYKVEIEDENIGYVFEYPMLAGQQIQAPNPLNQVIGLTVTEEIYGEDGASQQCYWEDKNGQPWAISGGTDGNGNQVYVKMYFYYPLQPGFWYGIDHDGDGQPEGPGQVVPWLPPEGFVNDMPVPVEVNYTVTWPDDAPVLKAGETLTFSGGEYKADHPEAKGLDGVLGWSSSQIIFDDQNPLADPNLNLDHYSARLIAPLLERSVDLPLEDIPEDLQPANGGVDVVGTRWHFKALHAGLKNRIFYDTLTQKLGIQGFLNNKTLGDDDLYAAPGAIYTLQPNILTKDERETLENLEGNNTAWQNAAMELYKLCRDPEKFYDDQEDVFTYTAGLEKISGDIVPKHQLGPGLALAANPNLLDPAKTFAEGYVTLAQNNHEDVGGPINLAVIKVVNDKYRGAIQVVLTDNVFDEKVTLRHTGDFGGNPDDLFFEWYYREDDGTSPETPDKSPNEWQKFGEPAAGRMEISIAGAGAATLVDNLFYVRYYHKNDDTGYSDWAGSAASNPSTGYEPQLLMGWVKRVRDAINPYEARIKDFRNSDAPATYAGMIQQAGQRYEGSVALSADQDVIESMGLIELYETVMDRARTLSIDKGVTSNGVKSTLLLAASMIADLYTLLGNEAFTDAQDPTIGFGSDSTEYGSLAPTIFTFQNQLPDLLSEELALLRGMDTTGARPSYNRLIWNFTKGQGEAAYALSYNISDVNNDGFIDEADGRAMYPQGHGDAWGHYLSALTIYYELLGHPGFDWESRSELYNIEGVVIDVDYYDERKFADIAAAKARSGKEITDLTYRSRYVEDPDGQWQGYTDTDDDRGWGVTGWARRAGQGAYLDWLTANAIIPSKDEDPTHTGLKKIDRTTITEIQVINASAADIRKTFENANTGLTPLGLSVDVVPFDIDTSYLNREYPDCRTHFEQVYDRAMEAVENALVVFDYANEIGNMLRQTEVSVENFRREVNEQDIDYRNRLIEIFGSPYEGVIGPGKPYPPGYKGPDYMLFNYVDVTDVSNDTVPPPSETMTAFFKPGFFWVEVPEEGINIDIATTYSHFFEEDMAEGTVTDADFSGVLEVDFPMSAADYAFQAPEEWGIRRSPGEIQQVLSELVQAQADLMFSLGDYAGHMQAIIDAIDLLEAKSDMIAEVIRLKTAERDTAIGLNSAILAAKLTSGISGGMADLVKDSFEATAEALPTSIGMSTDATAPARSATLLMGIVAQKTLRSIALASDMAAESMEFAKGINELVTALEVEKEGYKYEIKEQLKGLKALLGDEAPKRVEIFRNREAMRQVSEKYRATLEAGLRLMEERKRFNAKTAAVTQQHRYQDMTFRVSRNDALQKYRASFDMAAKYVYLAAKTYDYETNLSPTDPGSSWPLLTNIVKQRTLGQFDDGAPIAGQGGLADILARLNANFAVLKNQMGFSNPQVETGRFSLRDEYLLLTEPEEGGNEEDRGNYSDAQWRQYLSSHRVNNLWDIPEFRRYCRPFAPESAGPQPGIVLEFPTQIIFGYNVFGRELQAGDHAYDPTHFTTKIRSVGAWFDNYDGQGLSLTPRIYLVPVGLDVMLVPTSGDLEVREWNVVDQRLPVPLPAGQSDLQDPDYIPMLDSLDGVFWDIRRFSSFRAYHDAGYFDTEEMTTDSRLVGRSVWNTGWMLIIPGGTLLHDPDEGLDTFIYGQEAPGATGDSLEETRDLNGVTDIKLFFETYAISGN